MKKVALVGAGERTKNYNLPILNQMKDKIEIVGVTTKSGKVTPGCGLDGVPVFSSVTEMTEKTSPDVIVVSIKSSAVSEILDELLVLDTTILLETTDDFEVYSKIEQQAAGKVGILEQWPFLPLEQLKKKALDSGALGRITMVENNFRTYDYHGSAQIRNYLSAKTNIASLKGITNIYGSEAFINNTGEAVEPSTERVRIKTGIFHDGTLLMYKYSDSHKKMPFRGHSTLNVYGTRGSIVAGCLTGECWDMNVLDSEDDTTHNVGVQKEYEGEEIKKLTISLPNDLGDVVWENKYNGLSEYQLATAHLFEEMLVNENIIYGVDDAIQDMIIAYTQ